jgi:hypothetical protein
MDLIHVIGGIGTIMVLAAYFLLSAGRIAAASTAFQGLNLTGAALLALYALVLSAWAVVALNTVWALIALVAIARVVRNRRRIREVAVAEGQ